MIKGELKIEKTARYFLSGPLDHSYSKICFALHGYGQLASYFSRKFQHQELQETLFICPEGLHRFYLTDSSGRVGASWMTKEDRLTDIDDYCYYLDSVYEHFRESISKVEKVGILGFSQGVATACRWIANSKYSFHFLINWAGAFPPDLNFEKAIQRMNDIPLWMALGDEDEYITDVQFENHLALVRNKGFEPRTKKFKGKHSIYKEPLLSILKEI